MLEMNHFAVDIISSINDWLDFFRPSPLFWNGIACPGFFTFFAFFFLFFLFLFFFLFFLFLFFFFLFFLLFFFFFLLFFFLFFLFLFLFLFFSLSRGFNSSFFGLMNAAGCLGLPGHPSLDL